MSAPSIRLGVLGGTFDPIHIAHLIIAEEARVRCSLDKVLFVPARVSPLKQGEGTLFGIEERCEMVRLAIADQSAFALSRVDLDRPGPSYTADTLRLLQQEYGPTAELHFVMGGDSLAHLRSWHRPDEIMRLARLVVITRRGYALNLPALEGQTPGVTQSTTVLEGLDLGVSSTEIRRRILAGLPIRYQVPAAVEAYICTHPR